MMGGGPMGGGPMGGPGRFNGGVAAGQSDTATL
jgi:hypothetical protein